MSNEAVTILLIVAAFAALAWPMLRHRLGLGGGLSAADVKARVDRGVPLIFLDVRQAEEVARNNFPGAINIPLANLAGRTDEIVTLLADRPETGIIVICQTGMRAERALPILVSAGFKRIAVLKGGIARWQRDGFQI